MLISLFSFMLLGAPPVKGVAPANNDDVYKLVESYMNAITGKSDDQTVRDMHLGGASWMAQTVTYDSWKLVTRDPVRRDTGELAEVVAGIKEIDKAGRKALDKMTATGGTKGDEGEEIGMVTAEQAAKLMAPASALMAKFKTKFPTFHYVSRMEKDGYWHPKNPVRPLLDTTPKKGAFDLEVHRFVIEAKDGRATKMVRLKIVRLKVPPAFDTGLKILPAADWNPEE